MQEYIFKPTMTATTVNSPATTDKPAVVKLALDGPLKCIRIWLASTAKPICQCRQADFNTKNLSAMNPTLVLAPN